MVSLDASMFTRVHREDKIYLHTPCRGLTAPVVNSVHLHPHLRAPGPLNPTNGPLKSLVNRSYDAFSRMILYATFPRRHPLAYLDQIVLEQDLLDCKTRSRKLCVPCRAGVNSVLTGQKYLREELPLFAYWQPGEASMNYRATWRE